MKTVRLEDIDRKVSSSYNGQLLRFLTDKSNIISAAAFATGLGLTNASSDPGVLLPMITGAAGYAMVSSFFKAVKETKKFSRDYRIELIRNTQEYNECLDTYYNLVNEVASLMYDLGIRDSLDIAMFYNELLYNGYLSATGEFTYHKYDVDKDYCQELYGARVTSGRAVCRHMAMNLKDIYDAYGYTASYLAVKGAKGNFGGYLDSRLMPHRMNHAVVCVKDRYGKYIVDPTWEKVAMFDSNDNFATIIGENLTLARYIIGYNSLIEQRKHVNYDNLVGVMKAKNAQLNQRIVDASRYRANVLFEQKLPYIRSFYRHILSQLKTIAELEYVLSNYHDECNDKENAFSR